jgi:hypothetical protein
MAGKGKRSQLLWQVDQVLASPDFLETVSNISDTSVP